ncbi:hypothetical protein AB0F03_37280 [Streptomyces sp. NPDC028722]|uniref:hypothetical protein n=1 Tax=unclassified Streptomyces TaxID=2593676 RepID=UPI0033C58273
MAGYRSSRPPTKGWADEQKTEYDRLWEKYRTTSAAVYTHDHWQQCGNKGYEARQALKRKPEAQPVAAVEPTAEPAREAALAC